VLLTQREQGPPLPRDPLAPSGTPPASGAVSDAAFKAEVERLVRARTTAEAAEREANGEFKASVDDMIKTTLAPDRLSALTAAPPAGTPRMACRLDAPVACRRGWH
jgi:hypothetical protein